MAKKYSEELSVWLEKQAKKKRRLDAGAIAFLTVKADVIDAIEVGYSMNTIWEHMHETGRVKVSYETFRRYVKRYITAKVLTSNQAQAEPIKTADTPKKATTSIPTFTFKPISNKEDLF